MTTRRSDENSAEQILTAGLFHQRFYEHQRSDRFASAREALSDFLDHGASQGASPHPLFSVAFYRRVNADVLQNGANPLLHYLSSGWREGRDPHPLFDSAWYSAQVDIPKGLNPLSHYLRHAFDQGKSPNRLFDTQFYIQQNEDAARALINPLEHYVLYGRDEGRPPHRRIQRVLPKWRNGVVSLKRGAWELPSTIFAVAAADDASTELLDVLRELPDGVRPQIRVILDRDGPLRHDWEHVVKTTCLEDYGAHTTGNRDFRPSVLRMVLFALLDTPHVALVNIAQRPELVEALTDLGVSVAEATDEPVPAHTGGRVIRVNSDLAPLTSLPRGRPATAPAAPRRLIVPCMDWSLSGVHMVAEALGKELITRGWDVRLLFTRGTLGVLDPDSADGALPRVPYEFLDVSQCPTMRDRWAAIIRHLEHAAPCVCLATFDDFANAVAPALSDQVGVVGWLQSDEDHYYESAYRLGRYWNAIACVSGRIAQRVTELNPAFAEKIHIIHNSTVSRGEVVDDREIAPRGRLRLAYVGRFVHHQKRVLDFIRLLRELERAHVSYRCTLIGAASGDGIDSTLKRHLAEQLATGKVRLTGRLTHPDVFRELQESDVFILLSDFEGLPVSLIEAMACGCVPVVASVQSGIPEIVTDGRNGVIIEGRDYRKWAAVLASLSRDDARLSQLSEAARRTIVEQHCTDVMADRFEALFSRILEEIENGRYTRPPALTWQNSFDDVLLPPSMQGRIVT